MSASASPKKPASSPSATQKFVPSPLVSPADGRSERPEFSPVSGLTLVTPEGHVAGMGAIVQPRGVAFRVWAPNAQEVFVIGSFNNWDEAAHPLVSENNGYWYGLAEIAKPGDEYRFLIVNGEQRLKKIDPYARCVTNSVGNGVIYQSQFDWGDDHFEMPPWNEAVIYELHVGTFTPGDGEHPGTFEAAIGKLSHLKTLGINVIEVMPACEFAGDYSWGYNPAHINAIEQAYGGPDSFKRFVKAAHQQGMAVVLDVVYNHFGPSDLDLWRFDGWSEHDGGGIYFYNDWRRETPWGETRPDYGRGEVRQFIRDNAVMWLEEFHVDGLRFDMTLYMRTVRGVGQGCDLPDGWSLTQWVNREVRDRYPGKITIAEDLQSNEWLTRHHSEGGAYFGAQWCAEFVHPVRAALITPEDAARSLEAICKALMFAYNGDPFQRVVYTESHDEVANGKARVTSEVTPDDPQSFFAQKRSSLGAALTLTAPGIPMLFQGQEFLEGGWFQDTVPVDWDLRDDYRGIVRLYRDLIRLRRNRDGVTRGLCGRGINVFHLNEAQNVLGFQRWDVHGPGDDVVVIINLSNELRDDYRIGFPSPGEWTLRLNSDWKGYSQAFTETPSTSVLAVEEGYDGLGASASVKIGPYSVLIYSQTPGLEAAE